MRRSDEDDFQPQHRSDSRRWLLTSPGAKPETTSCLKEDFPPPQTTSAPKGRRAQLLEKFFWQQTLERVKADMMRAPCTEPYCSEYDSNYSREVPHTQLPKEVAEQFPLYSDSALTYWRAHRDSVPGVTTAPTPIQPFRRCSAFSRRMEEELDQAWR